MVKVDDIAYATYRVSDLARTEAFMHDFGLVTVQRDERSLYMRGTGHSPVVYVAHASSLPGFQSVALHVEDAGDFESAALLPGASEVRDRDAPGGGKVVEVQVPGGFTLELVHGMRPADPIDARPHLTFNTARVKGRINATQRPPLLPAQVVRMGHAAIAVANAEQAREWLQAHMGMIVSDTLVAPDSGQPLGFFMRCNRGDRPADHHTFLIANLPEHGAHHISFEVEDLDTLQQGHRWMLSRGHESQWGVGRHLLGSQLFDYWWDPDGNRVEHYADGDQFDASVAPGEPLLATDESLFIWGPAVPATFFTLKRPPRAAL